MSTSSASSKGGSGSTAATTENSSSDHYPRCPELDKLKSVADRSHKVGEFIDWLNDTKHFHLAEIHEHTDECYTCGLNPKDFQELYKDKGWVDADELKNSRFRTPQCGFRKGQYVPANYNLQKLLAEFFEIDLNKVEDERRAVLAWVRRKNKR